MQQGTQRAIDPQSVPGWGVDKDPENDPTFPMKHHAEGEHDGYTWDRPDQQPVDVEVLHSNERPNMPAVFGTPLPPKGLSGAIRRAAFTYSEDSYGHWLPLMLADRVNMVEGLIEDVSRGYIPNIFSELGWKADWKHNRKGLITKIAIGTGAIVGIAMLMGAASRRKDQ